ESSNSLFAPLKYRSSSFPSFQEDTVVALSAASTTAFRFIIAISAVISPPCVSDHNLGNYQAVARGLALKTPRTAQSSHRGGGDSTLPINAYAVVNNRLNAPAAAICQYII